MIYELAKKYTFLLVRNTETGFMLFMVRCIGNLLSFPVHLLFFHKSLSGNEK